MTVAEALRTAAQTLAETSDTARLDAELLMAHALGTTRSGLLLTRMHDAAPDAFQALVARRAGHEPVAYILGHQEFYGRTFAVRPGVLIPRGDSESVVEAALAACPDPARVLDMGTGSGALLLTVLGERLQASGVGIDASPTAIEVAAANARNLGLEARAGFREADWTTPNWAAGLGRFDLVICNPPYVETDAALAPSVRDHEPASALYAGPDGLDDYRCILPQLRGLLTPEGGAVFEIGYRQGEAVAALARAEGFAVTVLPDLAGRDRAVICR